MFGVFLNITIFILYWKEYQIKTKTNNLLILPINRKINSGINVGLSIYFTLSNKNQLNCREPVLPICTLFTLYIV